MSLRKLENFHQENNKKKFHDLNERYKRIIINSSKGNK